MKFFFYLLFLILLFAGVFGLRKYQEAKEKAHPGTTDLSLAADLYLNNARLYIKEQDIERSLYHLNSGINAIELIEKSSDSLSIEEIETALKDLKKIRRDIKNGTIDKDYINHSFVIALNAVAAAQLRLSEKYILQGEPKEATYALKYANEHIHNALKYANDGEIQDELRAYRHIDSLVHSRLDSSKIYEIEEAISEIKEVK